VYFCDETQINLVYSGGSGYVWRRTGEELNEENVRETVKHGGGGNGVGFYCDNNAWNYPFYRREIAGERLSRPSEGHNVAKC